MEIQLVIFLAFTSATLVMNTILVLFAYKAFAKFTSNLTETIREFETNSATKAWVASLQSASGQAVTVTESAKHKFASADSVIGKVQSRYEFALAKADTRMAKFEKKMLESTKQVKEKVEGPAFKIAAVATGIQGLASRFGNEE